jgi:hypothetical protein
MGEVYRARDPRLEREVALKVVRSDGAAREDRLRRFLQEAKTAGSLNHPNILVVYDVGSENGMPYVVSELLDGQTLRSALADDALTVRKALEYGGQIAAGLAAAHEKGIVHRDVKPENLFVTRDGRVKILDFGLAKLLGEREADEGSSTQTGPVTVVGSVAYMSPEQARGAEPDHRSDVFSFGAVLFEMLAGERPFRGETSADTLAAILREDPPDLTSTRPDVPGVLDRIVRRCLEKRPEDRFHSAHDLRLALEAVAGGSGLVPATTSAAASRIRLRRMGSLAVLGLLAGLAIGLPAGRELERRPPVVFRQVSFKRGTVTSGRFSSDGNTILYSAAWQGQRARVFTMRLDSPEARAIGPEDGRVVGAAAGEVAIVEDRGVLIRLPLEGGGAREVATDVLDAAWSAQTQDFAVVRGSEEVRLEYPSGHELYKTGADIRLPRPSPSGERVAFVEEAQRNLSPSFLCVAERGGSSRRIGGLWDAITGIAWSADGRELWITGKNPRFPSDGLFAVGLDGRERLLLSAPGVLVMLDVFADRRVLLSSSARRFEAFGLAPGETTERDLAWLDRTWLNELSRDGRTLLFFEDAGGAGLLGGFQGYIRRTDGSPPVRLGRGVPHSLSPDGRSVLWTEFTSSPLQQNNLAILPTGAGDRKPLSRGSIAEYYGAWWFPDGRHALIAGNEAGRPRRLFVQDTADGDPRALTPEGVFGDWNPIAPDGRSVAANGPNGLAIYPVAGGKPTTVPGAQADDAALTWSREGSRLYVQETRFQPQARVSLLDVRTGGRKLWRTLAPRDLAGVEFCNALVAPDSESYAYYCRRTLSDLYVVEGLE